MHSDYDLVKAHKNRAEAMANIVLISFGIILARLWYLQIYKGDTLYQYSIENKLRKDLIRAPRGMVFSRDNKLLVHNTPRFDAVIIPQYLKEEKGSINKLSKILSLPVKKIQKILSSKRTHQARYQPVIIKKNISRKEVAIIETEQYKMPGISVNTFISRKYNDREIGGHLLGYISEISQSQLPKYRKRDNVDYRLGAFIGQAGLEEQHDFELRGTDGYKFVEVDAFGRLKRKILSAELFNMISNKPARPGNNIRLTIDQDLQMSAYKALEGKTGSAVALDIKTGEILAMVSRPSFDPSQFGRGISSDYWKELINNKFNPLRARSIQNHYPPGSTFKIIPAIAALEEGIVDENTSVTCTGKFRLGRRTYHCWKQWGHGKVSFIKALRESCDVYFYKIATKLDIDVLAKYARMFGFGTKTQIKLPRETSGLFPTREWKKKRNGEDWQAGETLSCVIGQSFVLVTPLQLAISYSIIANGGKLFRPFLVKEIFSNAGEVRKKMQPELVSEVKLSPRTLELVREGLFQVVNRRKGTAWWHRGMGIRMSGKTGTAQVVRLSSEKLFEKCEENEYKHRNHGLFAAYAPRVNPRIAVAAIVEHGCHGSSAAAPIAKSVITTFMDKYLPSLKEKYKKEDKIAYLKFLKEEQLRKKELERRNQDPNNPDQETQQEQAEGEP